MGVEREHCLVGVEKQHCIDGRVVALYCTVGVEREHCTVGVKKEPSKEGIGREHSTVEEGILHSVYRKVSCCTVGAD